MDKNKKKKVYDDDDGRSIADMSGLDPHHPFTPRIKWNRGQADGNSEQKNGEDRPWEEHPLSKEERRAFIWGALGAALLIGAVFVAGLALVIWLMLTFWA
ncbi:MAG: hypothetical protein E7671_03435 [Ruminococcaceae bacterium]|nr:hypothetical protein [Oscillospiraceae bacterium]